MFCRDAATSTPISLFYQQSRQQGCRYAGSHVAVRALYYAADITVYAIFAYADAIADTSHVYVIRYHYVDLFSDAIIATPIIFDAFDADVFHARCRLR